MTTSKITENRIVIYSNGIADFQRLLTIEPSQKMPLSIAVKQDHLADLIASFSVYGEVRLESPPTFQPTNALEGNLSIDTSNAMEDMIRQLSGSQATISVPGRNVTGTLIGLNQEQEGTSGQPIKPQSAVLFTESGIEQFRLRDIENIKFEDDEVNLEIEKALQKNYQRIKPNSSFVELELESISDEPQQAIIQYTIPAAAWKISYRLQINTEGKNRIQGYAVIDNNTEEDWNDYQICVVTGEPITFSTDLATSKTPSRLHKNLVRGTAVSPVEAAMSYQDITLGGSAGAGDYESDDDSVNSQVDYLLSSAVESSLKGKRNLDTYPVAENKETVQDEVGEFSYFESIDPVTIPAKRSTSVQVLTMELSEISSLLYYKESNSKR